jgi:hypothetical protein
MSALAVSIAIFAAIFAASASAAFEIESFEGATVKENGELDLRAGGHPYQQEMTFGLSTKDIGGNRTPDGYVKDIEIDFPAGFVGNPSAAAVCSEPEFESFAFFPLPDCPDGSQIGWVELSEATGGAEATQLQIPLYNMGAVGNTPAEVGYLAELFTLHSQAFLRTDGDNGVSLKLRDLPQSTSTVGGKIVLWGVPSDESHKERRNLFCTVEVGGSVTNCYGTEGQSTKWPRLPFISNPSDCSAPSLISEIRADSWQEQGVFKSKQFSFPPPQECSKLSFSPSVSWSADVPKAGAPSGYSFNLSVPQTQNPVGLAVPPVKKVVATLPTGTTVSPAGADGLEACSLAQSAIGTRAESSCPSGSAIGTATLETPLLPEPMKGAIYVAKPFENPFNSLYGIYLTLNAFGQHIKLPGKVDVDPQTGQVTTTFDQNPQLPFSRLELHFAGGPNGILSNPTQCGKQTLTAQIDSWGGQSVTSKSSFDLNEGCSQGFKPGFQAGTANPTAGKSSPFTVDVTRGESEAPLGSLSVKLPPGELAKLSGTPYCSDATLASISSLEGTGLAQRANPSCPSASRIGTAVVGAGPGTNPLYVNGSVYLAGPYKGAPLSIAVVTPAVAGPYDLGTVVVRNALRINPVTTEAEAVSDPLPQMVYGVPLGLREVRVELDKPDFTVNPTSCDPMSVGGVIGSTGGATASLSTRYQVGDCASLGLQPALAIKFSGAPTRRGGHPKLTATLTTRTGDANLKQVQVTLPKTEYLENAHIKTVCTRVQYAANQCPAQSIYGYARAWSPLLAQPLEGPVYLRSSSNKLPDLVASLNGQIHVDLDGRISSYKSQIRNTFENVPDAPVSKFVLTMQGGGKGLLVNNTQLCKAKPKATATFVGQNGKTAETNPLVSVGGCGNGKKAKAKK